MTQVTGAARPSRPGRTPHVTHASTRLRRIDAATGLAFVAPLVLGVIVLGLVPFAYVIWYSLHDWSPLSGRFEWIGLDNFATMLGDARVWSSLGTTFAFAGMLMVLNIPFALLLAVLLNRRIRGVGVFRAAFFFPVVVSGVAWVVVWSYLVAPNGGINGVLALVGVAGPNWLREPGWALFTVVVIQVFKGLGLNMIFFLAALQGVPTELVEAARMDGAGRFTVFRSIVLPLIAPTILMVCILTAIGAMDVFVPIQVLTSGGPGDSTTVLSYLLYRTAFAEQRFGYASAIGVLLFVVVFALAALQWSSRRAWIHDEV
ncbi:sugar ABC transporter permease [Microbacterium sp.]|uniref:carbohydrate ABC transporter permease n=1 Tax=Microbacterium sp. TaxID=51671 RepID=UPI0025F7842F|nr:sugar ABC transporter permease [Microbacterium sp.]